VQTIRTISQALYRPRFQQLRYRRCAFSRKRSNAAASFPSFLPQPLCEEFEDPDCIEILKSYKQTDVDVGGEQIKTGFIGPCLASQQTSDSNLPPVLLLHGFDSNVLEVFGRLASITPTYAVDILGYAHSFSAVSTLLLPPNALCTQCKHVALLSCCWMPVVTGALTVCSFY
jgi:pimeloyl-ACP methyl ester carboxylesterase